MRLGREESFRHLHMSGLLKDQSAFKIYEIKNKWSSYEEVGSALINIFFDKLSDPLAYEIFMEYCNSNRRRMSINLCMQLKSLGEQYQNYSEIEFTNIIK